MINRGPSSLRRVTGTGPQLGRLPALGTPSPGLFSGSSTAPLFFEQQGHNDAKRSGDASTHLRLMWHSSSMTDYLTLARAALQRAPLIDGHNDLAWEIPEQFGSDLDLVELAASVPDTHTDLPRLRRGCVGGQVWSVYVPSTLAGGAAVGGPPGRDGPARPLRHPAPPGRAP